jgi:hypothetical protein
VAAPLPEAAAGATFPTLTGLLGRWNALPANNTMSGSVVATATDLSGNGNDLSGRGTVGVQINPTGYNGHPAWVIVPSDGNGFERSSFALGGPTALSVFVVAQANSATVNTSRFVSYSVSGQDDQATSAGWSLSVDSSPAYLNCYFGTQQVYQAMTLDAHHRLGMVGTLSGGSFICYLDNVASFSTATGGAPVLTSGGYLAVGCKSNNGAFGGWEPDALICEVVICTAALTTTERDDLDAYFVAQWGT